MLVRQCLQRLFTTQEQEDLVLAIIGFSLIIERKIEICSQRLIYVIKIIVVNGVAAVFICKSTPMPPFSYQ